jgi:AraC-like DNA-binding protein
MRPLHPFHAQLYLGNGRALYCGPLQHLEAHLYGAPVLHVGIYGPFRIKLAGEDWQSRRCVVVPPGVRHALDLAGGIHGKLFVETDSADAPAFRRRFPYRRGEARALSDRDVVELFRWVYEENPSQAEVEARVDTLLAVDGTIENPLDARIKLAVELIRREPDRNFTQKELAEALGLSPSRVLHLFSDQLGVPYRRFRLWKRLMHSFALLHAQDNLTHAALDSGFADATHFSHAFRDTFGVNPAPVFRKIERFDLIGSA